MSLQHLRPGEPADLSPMGAGLSHAKSIALLRDETLELMRWVLPAGKRVPSHVNAGPVTVQCLEGELMLALPDGTTRLGPGQLAWVAPRMPHALEARTDCAVLVTLVRTVGGH